MVQIILWQTNSKYPEQTGPSCSKLTMSLVNDSLKFQMAILRIRCYFLLKKCENPLQRIFTFYQQKSNSVFAYVVDILTMTLSQQSFKLADLSFQI